jgi:hypothetical protein
LRLTVTTSRSTWRRSSPRAACSGHCAIPRSSRTVEVAPDGRTIFWRIGEEIVDLCADALWLMAHPENPPRSERIGDGSPPRANRNDRGDPRRDLASPKLLDLGWWSPILPPAGFLVTFFAK